MGFGLLLLTAACVPCLGGSEDDCLEVIRGYLSVKYDEVIREPGVVTGLAYLDQDLIAVNSAVLAKQLPDTQFYRTQLANDALEFYSVDLLVAATTLPAGYDIRTTVEPLFDDPSPKFLFLFVGLKARTAKKQRALAFAIADLFAEVTPEGASRDLGSSDRGEYRVQLLSGGRPWRNIVVAVGKNGIVNRVYLQNSRAGDT